MIPNIWFCVPARVQQSFFENFSLQFKKQNKTKKHQKKKKNNPKHFQESNTWFSLFQVALLLKIHVHY